MMCQDRPILGFQKCIALVSGSDNEEGFVCVGVEGTWKICSSVL